MKKPQSSRLHRKSKLKNPPWPISSKKKKKTNKKTPVSNVSAMAGNRAKRISRGLRSSALILKFPPNFVRQLSNKARRNCGNIGIAQVAAASWANSPSADEESLPSTCKEHTLQTELIGLGTEKVDLQGKVVVSQQLSLARVSINDLHCIIKPISRTLLDSANGNGLKLEYSFSSEVSSISPLLVLVEVFFSNQSTEQLKNISLKDDEPDGTVESANVLLEKPESELPKIMPVVSKFIGSHVHLIAGGSQMEGVELRDVKSQEDFVQKVKEAVRDKTRGEWVFLQVLQSFNEDEELPVSVRQIWFDLRATDAFSEKIEVWIFGSQSTWHMLVSELRHELSLYSLRKFVDSLSTKKIAIEALLLDQGYISGIGNWIADEVLYQARIHSMQVAATLSKESCETLHRFIKEVIGKAVEVGVDSSQYPSDWMFHFREKKPGKAFVDGKKIDFITAGGRTSAYVPELQKLSGAQTEKKGCQGKPRKEESDGEPESEDEENGSSKSRKSKEAAGGSKKKKKEVRQDDNDDDDNCSGGDEKPHKSAKRSTRNQPAWESYWDLFKRFPRFDLETRSKLRGRELSGADIQDGNQISESRAL